MKNNDKAEALATAKIQSEKTNGKVNAEMAERAKARAGKPLTFPADFLSELDNLDYNERGYVFDVAVTGWYAGVGEKHFKKYLSDVKRAIGSAYKTGGMLAADRASNLVTMKTFPYYKD